MSLLFVIYWEIDQITFSRVQVEKIMTYESYGKLYSTPGIQIIEVYEIQATKIQ